MAIADILEAVVIFDHAAVVENVKAAIESEISIDDILNRGLIDAMDIVGEKFSSGELFLHGTIHKRLRSPVKQLSVSYS